MNSELSKTRKILENTMPVFAGLYFIRHKRVADLYWYLIKDLPAGQEIGTKYGFNGAGLWEKEKADYLLMQYDFDVWEIIPAIDVLTDPNRKIIKTGKHNTRAKEHFIRLYHKKLIGQELALALGCDRTHICNLCKNIGVTPITQKDRLKAFILQHHKGKTQEALVRAANASLGTNTSKETIRKLIIELEIYPVSNTDRLKEYIRLNSHKTIDQIGAETNYTPGYVYIIAASIGIELLRDSTIRIRAERAEKKLTAKQKPKGKPGRPPVIVQPPMQHISEKYTQHGSPFGMADELLGIETITRKQ